MARIISKKALEQLLTKSDITRLCIQVPPSSRPNSRTSLFEPPVAPPPSRFPPSIRHDPGLTSQCKTVFTSKLQALLATKRPVSKTALRRVQQAVDSVDLCVHTMRVAKEADVNRFVERVAVVGAQAATALLGKNCELRAEVSTTFKVSPRVEEELLIVGFLGERKVFAVENKTSSVGATQFKRILDLAKYNAEWETLLPSVGDAPVGDQGAISIIGKLGYYMTDPFHLMDFAFFGDHEYFWVVLRAPPSSTTDPPILIISEAISYLDPAAYLFFTMPYLCSSTDFTFNSSPRPQSSLKYDLFNPPLFSRDFSTGLSDAIPLHFLLPYTHNQTLFFHPSTSSPTFKFPHVTLTAFDTNPSQSEIYRGSCEDLKVVLKLGGTRDASAMMAEASLYASHLHGVVGVPKLLANGFVEKGSRKIPAIILEDIGESVNVDTLADLSEQDLNKLESILRSLSARGVTHLDVEPRNIVRNELGAIGLVDFGTVRLDPGTSPFSFSS